MAGLKLGNVQVKGNRIQVRCLFKYKDDCKAITGARWNSTDKCWEYPVSPASAYNIAETLGKAGALPNLELDSQFVAYVKEFENTLTVGAAIKQADDLPEIPCTATQAWLHQKRAYYFAYPMSAVMLPMWMGTGKSKVAIDLIVNRGHMRSIILAPLSVVKDVWPRQFRTHAGKRVHVAALWAGSVADKARQAKQALDYGKATNTPVVIVVNYESAWRAPFGPCYDEAGKIIDNGFALTQQWDCAILDESHRIKSPGGTWSWFCTKLGDCAKQRICLTGTPMPHSPLDVYAQYRFLDKGIFGTSYNAFRQQYAEMGGYHSKQVRSYKNLEDLNRKFYSIAFFVPKGTIELPPWLPTTRACRLDPATMRAYKQLEDSFVAEVKGGKVTVTNALTKLLRLQQVTSGYTVLDDEEGNANAKPKITRLGTEKKDLLADVLEDLAIDEPVVIFARFWPDLDNIREVCEKQGRRVAELSGRMNQLADWQDGKYDAIVIQIQAGGVGIDLTRSRYCLYYSLGFSLGDYEQSMARVDRPGQLREGYYIHLIAEGTVDEKVYEALAKRKRVVEWVLEGINQIGNIKADLIEERKAGN